MGLSTIFYGLLGFVVLSAVAAVIFDNGPTNLWLNKRAAWGPIGLVIWAMGSQLYASASSNPCVVDNTYTGWRGNIIYDYFDCSPALLSGSAIDVSLFIWTWVPPFVVSAICAAYLFGLARDRFNNSKGAH